jgi:hypothetical protein
MNKILFMISQGVSVSCGILHHKKDKDSRKHLRGDRGLNTAATIFKNWAPYLPKVGGIYRVTAHTCERVGHESARGCSVLSISASRLQDSVRAPIRALISGWMHG